MSHWQVPIHFPACHNSIREAGGTELDWPLYASSISKLYTFTVPECARTAHSLAYLGKTHPQRSQTTSWPVMIWGNEAQVQFL